MEELNFTLQERRVPVAIDGKEWFLVEALEDDATRFHAASISAGTITEGSDESKTVRIDGAKMSAVRAQLVSDCLIDEAGRHPGLAVVKKWPHRVVKELFERAKEISDLVEAPQTRDGLDKAIRATEKSLAELRERRARLDDPKGSSEGTTSTSGRPTSPGSPSTSTSTDEAGERATART
jgi:hypothetical protein